MHIVTRHIISLNISLERICSSTTCQNLRQRARLSDISIVPPKPQWKLQVFVQSKQHDSGKWKASNSLPLHEITMKFYVLKSLCDQFRREEINIYLSTATYELAPELRHDLESGLGHGRRVKHQYFLNLQEYFCVNTAEVVGVYILV